ncbi:cytochrome-c oxidase, cbb3-type subunit II [uncultured Abyssibacter sp.]|uniref:cytochrome-c oxidase, cbb3-type subunit II n=1 Tax=uncultured Abyssibacter sp. TaxID=2320202 RepID=UPI0032B15AF9
MNHEKVEKHIGLMAILIAVVISVGGIVEIVPLMISKSTTEAAPGVEPLEPLQVAGRDVYVREGCYNCHSQQVRYLAEEVLRYGPAAKPGESVYDHPFQWGSKRTGPDLSRVGGRYNDEWHELHLMDPRAVVPESNMPGYPWLARKQVTADDVRKMMGALRTVGVPYTDADFEAIPDAVAGKTQLDALVAYLQSLKASDQEVTQ